MSDPEKRSRAEQALRDAWERERHQDQLAAIRRLTEQFAEHYSDQAADGRRTARREIATILLIALTLIASGVGDCIFWATMQDARSAADKAHRDNVAALNAAHSAAQDALLGAHSDNDSAVRQAQAASQTQHDDTLGALKRASEANGISKEASSRQLRAYLSVTPVNLLFENGGIYLEMNVHNAGQTPAKRMQINGAYIPAALGTPSSFLVAQHNLIREKSSMQVDVFPGIDRSDHFPTGIKVSDLANSSSLPQVEYISGVVTYSDVFGASRRTAFCIKFRPPEFTQALSHNTIYYDWCPGIYNRSN